MEVKVLIIEDDIQEKNEAFIKIQEFFDKINVSIDVNTFDLEKLTLIKLVETNFGSNGFDAGFEYLKKCFDITNRMSIPDLILLDIDNRNSMNGITHLINYLDNNDENTRKMIIDRTMYWSNYHTTFLNEICRTLSTKYPASVRIQNFQKSLDFFHPNIRMFFNSIIFKNQNRYSEISNFCFENGSKIEFYLKTATFTTIDKSIKTVNLGDIKYIESNESLLSVTRGRHFKMRAAQDNFIVKRDLGEIYEDNCFTNYKTKLYEQKLKYVDLVEKLSKCDGNPIFCLFNKYFINLMYVDCFKKHNSKIVAAIKGEAETVPIKLGNMVTKDNIESTIQSLNDYKAGIVRRFTEKHI